MSTFLGQTGVMFFLVRKGTRESHLYKLTHVVRIFRAMLYVSTMVEGIDERSRVIRRTIMRYLALSALIVFQATSVVVKKRFPTMEHLLEAGMCLKESKQYTTQVYKRYNFRHDNNAGNQVARECKHSTREVVGASRLGLQSHQADSSRRSNCRRLSHEGSNGGKKAIRVVVNSSLLTQ